MSARRLILAEPSLGDAAVVTASHEASSSLAAANLQTQPPTEWWRASTLAGLHLVIDLGAGHAGWRALWLGYHNGLSGDSWRVRAATSEASLTTAPAYDSGVVDLLASGGATDDAYLDAREWCHSLLWLGDAGTRLERWLRIDITTTGGKVPAGSDPYFQAGRLIIASAWRPTYDKDRGGEVTHGKDRGTVRTETMGGSIRVRGGRRAAPRTFTAGFLTRLEAEAFGHELDERVGEAVAVLYVEDPAAVGASLQRGMTYGLISPDPWRHEDADVYSRRYQLEPLL